MPAQEEVKLDALLYEAVFYEADKNGDGVLSYDEVYSIFRKYHFHYSGSEIQRMFKETNTSNTGRISFQEYMAAMGFPDIKEPKNKPAPSPVKKEEIKKVESKPVSAAKPKEDDNDPRKPALRRVFKTFDKDGNGLIDKTELRQVLMSLGKYFTEKEIDNMVKRADKDGSETLNYEEFIQTVFS